MSEMNEVNVPETATAQNYAQLPDGRWVPSEPIPYDPKDGRDSFTWLLVRGLRWLRLLERDPYA